MWGANPHLCYETLTNADAMTTKDVQVLLATSIRYHREKRGWDKTDLARRAGLSRPMISQLESGGRMPSFPTLAKLGKALGLTVHVRLVETR